MTGKKNRTAVRAAIVYLLLAGGSWMFADSYAKSYNRLTGEGAAPVSADVTGSTVHVGIAGSDAEIDLSGLTPDSKHYCAAYNLAPDELRLACYLIAAENGV